MNREEKLGLPSINFNVLVIGGGQLVRASLWMLPLEVSRRH